MRSTRLAFESRRQTAPTPSEPELAAACRIARTTTDSTAFRSALMTLMRGQAWRMVSALFVALTRAGRSSFASEIAQVVIFRQQFSGDVSHDLLAKVAGGVTDQKQLFSCIRELLKARKWNEIQKLCHQLRKADRFAHIDRVSCMMLKHERS